MDKIDPIVVDETTETHAQIHYDEYHVTVTNKSLNKGDCDQSEKIFNCPCSASLGYPCRHIFAAARSLKAKIAIESINSRFYLDQEKLDWMDVNKKALNFMTNALKKRIAIYKEKLSKVKYSDVTMNTANSLNFSDNFEKDLLYFSKMRSPDPVKEKDCISESISGKTSDVIPDNASNDENNGNHRDITSDEGTAIGSNPGSALLRVANDSEINKTIISDKNEPDNHKMTKEPAKEPTKEPTKKPNDENHFENLEKIPKMNSDITKENSTTSSKVDEKKSSIILEVEYDKDPIKMEDNDDSVFPFKLTDKDEITDPETLTKGLLSLKKPALDGIYNKVSNRLDRIDKVNILVGIFMKKRAEKINQHQPTPMKIPKKEK